MVRVKTIIRANNSKTEYFILIVEDLFSQVGEDYAASQRPVFARLSTISLCASAHSETAAATRRALYLVDRVQILLPLFAPNAARRSRARGRRRLALAERIAHARPLCRSPAGRPRIRGQRCRAVGERRRADGAHLLAPADRAGGDLAADAGTVWRLVLCFCLIHCMFIVTDDLSLTIAIFIIFNLLLFCFIVSLQ